MNPNPIGDVNLQIMDSNVVYTATCLYGAVVVLGIISVSIFIAVLIKGSDTFREFPFFTIVWHLTITNAVNIMIQATCIFPSMFVELDESEFWNTWFSVGSMISTATDVAMMLLVLLIAINRFSVFIFKPLSSAFTKDTVKYPLMVTWIAVAFFIYLRLFQMKTVRKFSKANFEFSEVFITKESWVNFTLTMIGYIIPLIIFCVYLLMYAVIKKKRASLSTVIVEENPNHSNVDFNLLLQGFLLSISLLICRMLNTVTPRIQTATWIVWVLSIVKAMSTVINNMLNPVLFLTTNITVRKIFKSLLKCESTKPKFISESDMPSGKRIIKSVCHDLKINRTTFRCSGACAVEPIVQLSNMDMPRVAA
ncbi:unnamed protein product [Caenorhabditis auriculariae]|uniref:G-protein coupled receptors family 1 profile domain-containing protein n=1 Tax=Caenorhabditis auriculariae TaxID=2777116 RepID=A0A8S1H8Y3_9PELO|nr:unnamed protein product [Caenorhabditis auriculariae]